MVTSGTPNASNDSARDSELAELREFRQHILAFVRVFCTYGVRHPMSVMAGVLDLAIYQSVSDEQKDVLKMGKKVGSNVFDLCDAVITLIRLERDEKEFVDLFKLADVDLKIVFDHKVSNAQLDMVKDFDPLQNYASWAECHLDHLPTVYGNEDIIHQIVQEILAFALKYIRGVAISFDAQCDEEEVVFVLRWESKVEYYKIQQKFETIKTAFALDEGEIKLYLAWKLAQLQGGRLHFDLIDQSTATITLALPRAAQ